MIGRDGYIAEIFAETVESFDTRVKDRDCAITFRHLTMLLDDSALIQAGINRFNDKSICGEKAVAVAAPVQLGYDG
jgi:hypothetical protein